MSVNNPPAGSMELDALRRQVAGLSQALDNLIFDHNQAVHRVNELTAEVANLRADQERAA